MQFKDYYKILGVNKTASAEEVKRAYRKLARKFHPDVSKEPNAEARFKEVNEAHEVLSDSSKRRAYDELGANWQAGQEFRPPPGWNVQFDLGGGRFGGGQFSDFFEALFGGGLGRGRARAQSASSGRHPGQARASRDEHARIAISLEDAFRGATRLVTLSSPEGERRLRINVPQGISAGQQIRLAGQGRTRGQGAPAGDLLLEVEFEPHRWFRAQGRDVFLDLKVAPWEAALGATATVPTLGGKVDLKIPAGAQSGQQLRLKGRGLPGSPAGDQYVVLFIVTPKAETPGARALYERMRSDLAFDPRPEFSTLD